VVGRESGASNWSLTFSISQEDGMACSLPDAQFVYGRDNTEMPLGEPMSLPSAVVGLIRSAGLTGQSMESGFVLEISSHPERESGGWWEFDLIFQVGPCDPLLERGFYTNGLGERAEMVRIYRGISLPRRIWMRVMPLPDDSFAWLLKWGYLGSTEKRQSTLHEFWEVGVKKNGGRKLPLPGPPLAPYNFL